MPGSRITRGTGARLTFQVVNAHHRERHPRASYGEAMPAFPIVPYPRWPGNLPCCTAIPEGCSGSLCSILQTLRLHTGRLGIRTHYRMSFRMRYLLTVALPLGANPESAGLVRGACDSGIVPCTPRARKRMSIPDSTGFGNSLLSPPLGPVSTSRQLRPEFLCGLLDTVAGVPVSAPTVRTRRVRRGRRSSRRGKTGGSDARGPGW